MDGLNFLNYFLYFKKMTSIISKDYGPLMSVKITVSSLQKNLFSGHPHMSAER